MEDTIVKALESLKKSKAMAGSEKLPARLEVDERNSKERIMANRYFFRMCSIFFERNYIQFTIKNIDINKKSLYY